MERLSQQNSTFNGFVCGCVGLSGPLTHMYFYLPTSENSCIWNSWFFQACSAYFHPYFFALFRHLPGMLLTTVHTLSYLVLISCILQVHSFYASAAERKNAKIDKVTNLAFGQCSSGIFYSLFTRVLLRWFYNKDNFKLCKNAAKENV